MATFIQKIQKFDTTPTCWAGAWPPSTRNYTLQSLVRTKTTGADGNFNLGRISDAKIDALVDAMKTEIDVTKRDAMMREALVATRDNYYYVPLHHQLRPWAMKKNVTAVHNAVDSHNSSYTRVD